MSKANPAAFYGDDCARQIHLAMTREDLLHQRDPGGRRHVRKANDSGMCRACEIDERPEIRIDRHQNAFFLRCQVQQRLTSPGSGDDSLASLTS